MNLEHIVCIMVLRLSNTCRECKGRSVKGGTPGMNTFWLSIYLPRHEHLLAEYPPPPPTGHEHFLGLRHEVCNRYSNCLLVRRVYSGILKKVDQTVK